MSTKTKMMFAIIGIFLLGLVVFMMTSTPENRKAPGPVEHQHQEAPALPGTPAPKDTLPSTPQLQDTVDQALQDLDRFSFAE